MAEELERVEHLTVEDLCLSARVLICGVCSMSGCIPGFICPDSKTGRQ